VLQKGVGQRLYHGHFLAKEWDRPCVKLEVPLLGGVMCFGMCRPGCGAVLLLLGAPMPGGGGSADAAHVHTHLRLLNCACLTVAGMVVGMGLLWMLHSADLYFHKSCNQWLAGH
jgi:hypothetical protein